jgi:predicted RNase H-like HicB family nuclease
MKRKISVVLALFMLSVSVYAQNATETLEKLRAQLLEVQGKEETLRDRLERLDESIKPENIERSLAGIGSTKPEELREARRRQLAIERDGVLAQLKTLETSRQRLEAAIATAEAVAYQQSARPSPTDMNQMMAASSAKSYQWFLLGGGGLAMLALGGGALVYRRKTRAR